MARPIKEYDKEGLLADYKTGKYPGRDGADKLALKYGISYALVYKAIKDIAPVNKQLLNKIIETTQELNQLNHKEYNSLINEANRVVKLKDRRDVIVEAVFNKIEKELPGCETRDVKGLVDSLDKVCITSEIAPRFNPNSGTTVNNQQNNFSATMSLDDYKREIALIEQRTAIN